MVVLDADDECPKDLEWCLAERAVALQFPLPIAIVCAKSEYETWFICHLSEDKGQEIRDRLQIPSSVIAPTKAEDIRDAKGWLTHQMPAANAYKATRHQASLTQLMDLDLTFSRSRSFQHICHAVEELVDAVSKGKVVVTPGPP